MKYDKFLKQILSAYPDEKEIYSILNQFEEEIKENFVIELLIEKRNNKINQKMMENNNQLGGH